MATFSPNGEFADLKICDFEDSKVAGHLIEVQCKHYTYIIDIIDVIVQIIVVIGGVWRT